MAAPYPLDPPAPDTPLKKACTVLARDTDLDHRILVSLKDEPKRYSQLRPLLEGRGDHNLTVSLRRLQEEGLIRRRAMASQGQDPHRYELSALGDHTLTLIGRIHQIAERAPPRSTPDDTWHVTPAREGGWRVVRAGADRAASRHETKHEAIDKGREIARNQHGRLVLHYKDGRIQRHHSYAEA